MSIFKKALEFLRDKKEEKIKELETKLLSAQTDIFKLGVKNADLELSLKSAESQSKSQNAECKNKLIYNANNQYVVVIDCNSDSFEGYITPDKVEQLKSADTQTIINLLTPPKVEEKGSDFDVDKLYTYQYQLALIDGKFKRLDTLSEQEVENIVAKRYSGTKDEAVDELLSAIFGEDISELEALDKEEFRNRLLNSRDKAKDFNNLLDIHLSVMSNPSSEVQSKIASPVS